MTHADEIEVLQQIAMDNGFVLAINPDRWNNTSYIQREHILMDARRAIEEFGCTDFEIRMEKRRR